MTISNELRNAIQGLDLLAMKYETLANKWLQLYKEEIKKGGDTPNSKALLECFSQTMRAYNTICDVSNTLLDVWDNGIPEKVENWEI